MIFEGLENSHIWRVFSSNSRTSFSPSSPWSDISVFKVLSNLSELVWLPLVWILGRVSIPDLRVRIRQRAGVMFSVGFHTCFTNAHTKSIIFLWTSPIKICVIIKKKYPRTSCWTLKTVKLLILSLWAQIAEPQITIQAIKINCEANYLSLYCHANGQLWKRTVQTISKVRYNESHLDIYCQVSNCLNFMNPPFKFTIAFTIRFGPKIKTKVYRGKEKNLSNEELYYKLSSPRPSS